jgi:hypothetical protein
MIRAAQKEIYHRLSGTDSLQTDQSFADNSELSQTDSTTDFANICSFLLVSQSLFPRYIGNKAYCITEMICSMHRAIFAVSFRQDICGQGISILIEFPLQFSLSSFIDLIGNG